jgi:hypothetical protein
MPQKRNFQVWQKPASKISGLKEARPDGNNGRPLSSFPTAATENVKLPNQDFRA